MKHPHEKQLEEESKNAFRRFLPQQWILRDFQPDYGLDLELTIVEDEEVTNKIVWIQLKATEKKPAPDKQIKLSIGTRHLEHYENCRQPVAVVFWIKPEKSFYCLFAQQYIRETLSIEKPGWRDQKTVTIIFPAESKLANHKALNEIATDGYLYLIRHAIVEPGGPLAWVDGIPESDNSELKERFLNAMFLMENEKHIDAIAEFENILRECFTISITEKMAILLNIGNAYYFLNRYDDAINYYISLLKLSEKINDKSAILGKADALGSIGLIYCNKGELNKSLDCLEESLKFHREFGCLSGEASALNIIANAYQQKGETEKALKRYEESLKIHRKIGNRLGMANQIGSIGVIYGQKGEFDKSLKCLKKALKIHREIGNRLGEASALGNMGNVFALKGETEKALEYCEESLKIHRKYGDRKGEANSLGRIGSIICDKGDYKQAINYLEKALKIHREFGVRLGEALDLRNIGLIYKDTGEFKKALKNLKKALEVLVKYDLDTPGKIIVERAINEIEKKEKTEPE